MYKRQVYEDIHSAVEINLKQMIGEPAEKLHTARSRNDQIVLDERLFLREKIIHLIRGINNLQKGLLTLAQKYPTLVMPGYTHLQPAQPILFAHHLLAYFFMLQRDAERLKDALTRLNQLPLSLIHIYVYKRQGLMWGLQVTGKAKLIVEKMLKKGVIVNAANDDVVRLLPPLIVGKKEIDQMVKSLVEVLLDIQFTNTVPGMK